MSAFDDIESRRRRHQAKCRDRLTRGQEAVRQHEEELARVGGFLVVLGQWLAELDSYPRPARFRDVRRGRWRRRLGLCRAWAHPRRFLKKASVGGLGAFVRVFAAFIQFVGAMRSARVEDVVFAVFIAFVAVVMLFLLF